MVFENYPVERSALAQVEVGLRVSSVEDGMPRTIR